MLATPEREWPDSSEKSISSDWQSRLGQNIKPEGTRAAIPQRCSKCEET
jgi:hypothetical protein